MLYVAHEYHLYAVEVVLVAGRWCSVILKWDDGTSGVSPTCFSMPASQPSILSWYVVEARAGEHDLEHDGCHVHGTWTCRAAPGVFTVFIYGACRFFFMSIKAMACTPAPPTTKSVLHLHRM